MSHIATYVCCIVNPNLDLLRTVFETLAAQHHGAVTTKIDGYFHKDDQEVLIGLTCPEFPRGLGVNIDPAGALNFICDPYDYEKIVESLKSEIVRTYQTVAVTQVLASLGYQVSTNLSEHGALIEGVRA